MESAETFIESQLDAKRAQLAQTEHELQQLRTAPRNLSGGSSGDITWMLHTEIACLQRETHLLEYLKERLARENVEAPPAYDGMTTRQALLSKGTLWLAVISATIFFILGWILALLSSS